MSQSLHRANYSPLRSILTKRWIIQHPQPTGTAASSYNSEPIPVSTSIWINTTLTIMKWLQVISTGIWKTLASRVRCSRPQCSSVSFSIQRCMSAKGSKIRMTKVQWENHSRRWASSVTTTAVIRKRPSRSRTATTSRTASQMLIYVARKTTSSNLRSSSAVSTIITTPFRTENRTISRLWATVIRTRLWWTLHSWTRI